MSKRFSQLAQTLASASLLLGLTACGGAATTTAPATMAPQATTPPTIAATSAPMPSAMPMPTEPPSATTAPTAQPTTQATTAAAPPSEMVDATIKLFAFNPSPLTIKAGTQVTWTNEDDIEHSVTAGTPPTASGAFDSGFFVKGESFKFTFSQPGTYSYFCMRHNSMVGVVQVN